MGIAKLADKIIVIKDGDIIELMVIIINYLLYKLNGIKMLQK